MADKFQFKRATAAQWTSSNPTLSAGEPGFETDTGKLKIGDGTSAWSSLSYTIDANYGTLALQDADDVTITGGSITNIAIGASAVSKSADYTITDDDGYDTILVTTGATDRTITLPTAADNTNRIIKILKVDSGAGKVTVDGEGAETINGYSSADFEVQYSGVELICDGSEWFVMRSIGCELVEISSALEAVYTKALTGTLDADSATSIPHGLSDMDKIISISFQSYNSNGALYRLTEIHQASSADGGYTVMYGDTNIEVANVGSYHQGQAYRVEIRYWI